jgi:hypothetical protein
MQEQKRERERERESLGPFAAVGKKKVTVRSQGRINTPQI